MSSYIYMKILESQPKRYDRGISWLSFGQAGRIKQKIVDENITPGSRALEIGCGTGTMAVLAAKQGAYVVGFDVSGPMLEVARKKIADLGLADKIEISEMGVSGMDKFSDESFDLVMSTLVFSELSADEQAYALRHAWRVLKPGGRLALADEARPKSAFKKLLHTLVRIPLLITTFLLTQTTTRAVEGLEERVTQAGFRIESTELRSMDSFIYISAAKEKKAA